MISISRFDKLSLGMKTRLLQYVFLLGSCVGFLQFNLVWISLGFLIYFIFQLFAVNIGLHRYFCHRSFKVSCPLERILALIATLTGVGSIIAWVAQHHHHHENSDSPNDAHSPHHQSVLKIIFGLWKMNITKKDKLRHLFKSRYIVFLHKHYFKVHFLYSGLLLMLSYKLFIYAYCLPNFLCLLANYSLAIIDHIHGYQTYDNGDQSKNSWLAAILTIGEGWHNNHHHAPQNYRQGERPWELDPPGFIIKYFLMQK